MPDPFVLAERAVAGEEVAERFNGKNQYLIPDPDTGTPIGWTRATNLSKILADTDNLQRWAERMVALGLAERPDLLEQAKRLSKVDRKALDRIAKTAKEAAGAFDRAAQGTSLHTLTERVDLGEITAEDIEPPWRSLIQAYVEAMRAAQIKILPEYIERTVIIKRFKVAGTFDRVVQMPDGDLWIGDLKTGRTLDYSWGDIAIQLSLYANADAIWDFDQQQFLPMPKVNQERALIMHMPVEGGGVTFYEVNIKHGWAAAELSEQVKNWRKNSRKLSAVLVEAQAEPMEDPDLPVKWTTRIDAATSSTEMSRIWEEAVKVREWTPALTAYGQRHLDRLLSKA